MSYLRDLYLIHGIRTWRLALINLVLLALYVGARSIWPIDAPGGPGTPILLGLGLTLVFVLNILLMLFAALPQMHHGLTIRDDRGEELIVDEAYLRSFRPLPLIIVTYVFTLAFGLLFLVELMQAAALADWISCAPETCRADMMDLATRVAGTALFSDLHVAAENVFGLLVLLVHAIMNIVLLTLLIPALLAFRG